MKSRDEALIYDKFTNEIKDGVNMSKSCSLKSALLFQSITPLFFLIIIKYINCKSIHKIVSFFRYVFVHPITAIKLAWVSEELLRCGLLVISAVVVLIGAIIYFSFKRNQHMGFASKVEKIKVGENISDVSVAFFVTYVIPLLMDDLDSPRGILLFLCVLSMMLLMMRNTQLCYQNPILSMAGYRIFRFTFEETIETDLKGKEYIGVTIGKFDDKKAVVRKKITDGVYMIYNKNGGENDGR